MTKVKLDLAMALDRTQVRLAIVAAEDNRPLAHVNLSTTQIDVLLTKLAVARAGMPPAVPAAPPARMLRSIQDPAWLVKPHPETRGGVLDVRHPGYGWLSFLLPATAASGLIKAIQQACAHRPSLN